MTFSDLNSLVKQSGAVVEAEGLTSLLSKTCRFLGMQLFGQYFYQSPIIKCIKDNATAHKTFIDIGASTGIITKAVAKYFQRCLVVEPAPKRMASLLDALQPAKNVIFAQCALASQPGRGCLFQSRTNPDDASLFPRVGLVPSDEVEIDTLDNLVDKTSVPEPYFMKIDVQGAELEVLKGASRILKKTEAIVTEVWPYGIISTGREPREYLRFLLEQGFSPYDLRARPVSMWRLSWFCHIGANNKFVSTDLLFRRRFDSCDKVAVNKSYFRRISS